MRCRSIVGLLFFISLLSLALPGRVDEPPVKRKSVAKQISRDLVHLRLHKIYVPDFVDPSGARVAAGSYLAASLSKLLTDYSKNAEIISRVEAHKYLGQHGASDGELPNAEVMSKLVSEFAVDGFLFGVIATDQSSYTIQLSIRDSRGKELIRTQYAEKADASVVANLPVGSEQSSERIYFAGLDAVTTPKCLYCPLPSLTKATGTTGEIVLSVLVTPEGRADHIYLAKKLNSKLDIDAIETVKSWRFEPAIDSDGKKVAVRVPVEVTYRSY